MSRLGGAGGGELIAGLEIVEGDDLRLDFALRRGIDEHYFALGTGLDANGDEFLGVGRPEEGTVAVGILGGAIGRGGRFSARGDVAKDDVVGLDRGVPFSVGRAAARGGGARSAFRFGGRR